MIIITAFLIALKFGGLYKFTKNQSIEFGFKGGATWFFSNTANQLDLTITEFTLDTITNFKI